MITVAGHDIVALGDDPPVNACLNDRLLERDPEKPMRLFRKGSCPVERVHDPIRGDPIMGSHFDSSIRMRFRHAGMRMPELRRRRSARRPRPQGNHSAAETSTASRTW
jgi:hypothetical protein